MLVEYIHMAEEMAELTDQQTRGWIILSQNTVLTLEEFYELVVMTQTVKKFRVK